MAESSSSARNLIFGLIAVCFLGLGFVLYEPDAPLGGSPRDDRIAEFREQADLREGERLTWSPLLMSETYDVGAVFPVEGLGHAVTTACKAGEPTVKAMTLRLGDGKEYEIKPDLDLGQGVKLDLTGAKSLEYVLSIKESRVLPAYGDLVRALSSDPECLAMIANRPVMVLYGVFRGDENYSITRSLAGNLKAGKWKELFGAGGGLGGEGTRNSDFSREDSSLLWSLTKVHLTDVRFPNGEGTEAFRLQKAEELLRQETDYANRAEERVEVSAPSLPELNAVFKALSESAQ